MKSLICDLCGEKITGEYREVFISHTGGLVARGIFASDFHNDVCNACWNALTKMRRIPLVEFPNTEAKDHE